jgi:hypothetical protein
VYAVASKVPASAAQRVLSRRHGKSRDQYRRAHQKPAAHLDVLSGKESLSATLRHCEAAFPVTNEEAIRSWGMESDGFSPRSAPGYRSILTRVEAMV